MLLLQGGACIHGYTEDVEQPFLVPPFSRYPGFQEGNPKWWTAHGTALRVAQLEKDVGHQPADGTESDEEHGSDADATSSDSGAVLYIYYSANHLEVIRCHA
jgi:hypothetical protein